MRTAIHLVAAVSAVAFTTASCGGGGHEVTSEAVSNETEAVSNETTAEMLVFAPEDEGPWPVIVAYHGVDGTAQDMAELGTRLAEEGSVVFAPTYSTDLTTMEGAMQAAIDAECGHRFARRLAARYGADLNQPVTFVGWSLGASAALGIGLDANMDPSGEVISCFDQVPRPDIVVAVSGCHYEGGEVDLVGTESWENKDADVILLAGEKDANCPPQQTKDAATEMRSAGYGVRLEMLPGANHFEPVFHALDGDKMVDAPDNPTGERVVEVVMDAIAARQDR